MASTYVHIGDLKEIPEDAPPTLHFLRSFISALDGTSHTTRSLHFSPSATIKTNADAPLPFAGMAKMFEMRDQMTASFSHTVNRVWIIAEAEDKVTLLMDWSSTTILKGKEDKPAFVAEFAALKLGKAGTEFDEEVQGPRGVNGFWIEKVENWMDPSPVQEARKEILEKAAPKV
ncbi:uncharacterized protein BDR25DRAFT_46688 [Lindgomyces ingoldianus]|uniref:Uncharacterized protein n=1 Tax=Lindgomyces ingoldianus TaxID=673940 RepID=A0ACB6QRT1_9PLEO|nr:uncharacterized protein BDR25DRAFT_46688 [Lindgomyces ingoldianus]KAF2469636.1 hypothetical protein BDR25DRAFT_46688 [Lindgomyces ingoldianus]